MPNERTRSAGPRTVVYHANLPPLLAVLLVAPLLFIFLSFALFVLAGGTLVALTLPLFMRGRRRPSADANCIELDRDQYSRVDQRPPQLPPH